MNILDYLKSALSTNWPTMVVLFFVWWNLNGKMEEVIITATSNQIKVEQHEKRLDLIESKLFVYVGTAKKEDDENVIHN